MSGLVPLAGGIAASMFGGGGQKQKSQQTATTFDLTRPEFRNLGQTASAGLGGFLAGGPAGSTPYSGPLTAGLGGNEGAQLAALQSGAINPLRSGLINQTIAGNFLPGQAGSNPFLGAA